MSYTSKSPVDVARVALRVAAEALPRYAHRFSPRKFTQPQLFACLVLKTFFKTDYRGIVIYLDDLPDLVRLLGLKAVPHWTTLQKASKRLLSPSLPSCSPTRIDANGNGEEASPNPNQSTRRNRP